MQIDENRITEGQIEGKNAVMEALKAGRSIDKVIFVRGETDRSISFIVS
jgi:23S rRNA (guanosine2251-2'-O)-methyltransferase